MSERTHGGRPPRLLTVIDEYSRECLTIELGRRLTSHHEVRVLAGLFRVRGTPSYIRSDNGPEFTAALVRKWLEGLEVGTLFIQPGSPWYTGHRLRRLCSRPRPSFFYEAGCGIATAGKSLRPLQLDAESQTRLQRTPHRVDSDSAPRHDEGTGASSGPLGGHRGRRAVMRARLTSVLTCA